MGRDPFVIEPVLERIRLGSTDFDCLREGTGHRLQIWGCLPLGWAGNLALHLFVAGLQVVTGDAMRTAAGTWAASFLLQSDDPQERARHDFLNMARRGPRLIPELPEPDVTVDFRRSHDFPNNVYARVAGKDSIGLVAHVLRRFAGSGLRPRRFILRTTGKEIEDWFWLEPDRHGANPRTSVIAPTSVRDDRV